MKQFLILALFLTGCQSPKFMTNAPYKSFFIKRGTFPSECPGTTGVAIDIYTDKDMSGTFSGGDNYENSLYSCNGLDAVGKVSKFDMTTGVCVEVLVGKIWANKLMNNSGAVRLYNGPVCSGNIVSTLKDDKDEVFFFEEKNALFVVQGMKLNVLEL